MRDPKVGSRGRLDGQQILPVEFDRALQGRHRARYGLEQCRFARAIGANDRREIALPYMERHFLQDGQSVVAGTQVRDSKHWRPSTSFRGRRQ